MFFKLFKKNKKPSKVYTEDLYNIQNNVIISKVDNIFLSFTESFNSSIKLPFYFTLLNLISSIIIFNVSVIGYMYIINFSKPINSTFCYENKSSAFYICNQQEYCRLIRKCKINNIYYYKPNFNYNINQFKQNFLAEYDHNNLFNLKQSRYDSIKFKNKLMLKDLIEVNMSFRQIFLTLQTIYSNNNIQTKNKINNNFEYINLIFIDYGENFNILVYFGMVCFHTQIFAKLVVFSILGILIGSILFGYLTDLLGRHKVLVISTTLCFICLLMQILITININYFATNSLTGIYYASENNKAYNTLDTIFKIDIKKLLNNNIIDSSIKNLFLQNYNILIKTSYYKKNLAEYFIKHQFLFFLTYMILISSIIGQNIANTCIVLENSLNSNLIYNNLIMSISKIVSLLIAIIITYFINNFLNQLIFIASLNFFLLIIIINWSIESFRYNYEFLDYVENTHNLCKIFNNNNKFYNHFKKSFYIDYNETKIIHNLNKKDNNKNTNKYIVFNKLNYEMSLMLKYYKYNIFISNVYKIIINYEIMLLGYKEFFSNIELSYYMDSRFYKNKNNSKYIISNKNFLINYHNDFNNNIFNEQVNNKLINNKKHNQETLKGPVITKKDLAIYPIILIHLCLNNKNIKKNILGLVILTITSIYNIISIIITLNNNFINKKEDLYVLIFFNYRIYLCLFGILIVIFNYWLVNFYSLKQLYFYSQLLNIIICLIYFITRKNKALETYDNDIYFFNSIELIMENNYNKILVLYIFLLAFSLAIYHNIILFYVNYSHTLYRGSSFGIFYFIYYTMLISAKILVENYDIHTSYVIIIFSIVGLINVFYMKNNSLIIKDNRKFKTYITKL